LIEALSLLEVTIDFADEEVPVDVMPDVRAALNEVLEWIDAELVGLPAAELVRDGFEVAIVGPPNAGKSTLLNCLAGREAAITSDIAGTTRDVIEVRMDLGGYAVTFLDTAGLRDSSDPVEKIGIERGVIRAKAADMRVFLGSGFELIPEAEGDLIVLPKVDTAVSSLEGVSGKTGAGVADLLERIESVVSDRVGGLANATHDRHADALRGMKQVLSSAMRQVDRDAEPELTSQEIREALASLDALLGRTDVEDVLDVIFSNFCLGK
jgi:tRNA modification GTPase